LGQSKRQFGTQLKEHQKAVSTLDKGKSALAQNVCYTKHEIAWENSKVITTNNRYGQRLCLEAWHINMSNHALNRDDSASICQRNTCISLSGDVIPWVFKKPRLHL
jgi:hypothetical protein